MFVVVDGLVACCLIVVVLIVLITLVLVCVCLAVCVGWFICCLCFDLPSLLGLVVCDVCLV